MYVVHIVQGVHTKVRQPMMPVHAPLPAQRATYSKEQHSIVCSRTSSFPFNADAHKPQEAHFTGSAHHSLTAYQQTAAGLPVAASKAHTNAPTHRAAAGMLSKLLKPLKGPRAVAVHPNSSSAISSTSGQSPIMRNSRNRLTFYSTRPSVIHLPAHEPGNMGSSSGSNSTATRAAPALPVPPPAALQAAVKAIQHKFVPVSSVLAAAAADSKSHKSLQLTAAAVQGYLISCCSSSSSKMLSRRSRHAVVLPAKLGSSRGQVMVYKKALQYLALRRHLLQSPMVPPAAVGHLLHGMLQVDPKLRTVALPSMHALPAPTAAFLQSAGSGRSNGRGAASSPKGFPNGTSQGAASSGSGRSTGASRRYPATAGIEGGGGITLPTTAVRLARMGVALMGLAAAAALAAVVLIERKHTHNPSAAVHNNQVALSSNINTAWTDNAAAAAALAVHSNAATSPAGSSSSSSSKSNNSAAVDGYDGPGYYEWMEKRLQSALQQFGAEQDMLRAELAMLQTLSKKNGNSSARAGGDSQDDRRGSASWFHMRRWFSQGSSSTSSDGIQHAGFTAPAAEVPAAGTDTLTAAAMRGRIAEIHEQLESLDVLRAALTAELMEQKQQHQQQQQDV